MRLRLLLVCRLAFGIAFVPAALAADGSDVTGKKKDLEEYLFADGHGDIVNLVQHNSVDQPEEDNRSLSPSPAPSAFDEFDGANSTSVDTLPIRLDVPASNFGWVSVGGGAGGDGGGGHGGDDFGGGMRRRSNTFQDDISDDYDMNEFLPHDVLLEFMGVPRGVPGTGWAHFLRHGNTLLTPIRNFFHHVGNSLHSA